MNKTTDPLKNVIRQQDYPQMPSSFHQALVSELERQNQTSDDQASEKIITFSQGRSARQKKTRLVLIPAVAAMLGLTVFAATRFHLEDIFPERLSSPEAQELIQTEPTVQVEDTARLSNAVLEQEMESEAAARPALPDNSPLLDIQETMFDGTKLYIYGEVTDNGRQYSLNADRLYINGEEIGPVSTNPLYEELSEPYGYSFEADLSSLHLTEAFEVTLPLSVYEKSPYDFTAVPSGEADTCEPSLRYQNQDLTFTVAAASTPAVASDQSFTYDDFTLEVSGLSVSASVIRAQFFYHMTPEQLAAYTAGQETEGKVLLYPLLKSSDGELCTALSISGPTQVEGGIQCTVEYTGAVSPEDDSVIVITQFGTEDADGKIDVSAAEAYAESTVKLS